MADFSQLAGAIKTGISRQGDFVASEAIIDDGRPTTASEITATPAALTDLAGRALLHAEDRTSLYFLKGDPGAGKTTLLREATALQAQRYLDGGSNFLFFYVSAQGRELSNLRDAFSGELDDLRAAFTRDAIATLARRGLLVPIVDGFDELLGTAGYGGAFSSLQNLLVELEGLGAVVVSARSAFYDLEFLARSTGPVDYADISITTVDLQPWTDEQLQSYLGLDSATHNQEQTAAALERLEPHDRQLLRRPFFASRFESFVARSFENDGELDLLGHLIAAYTEREADKIVDANGDPVLPVDGHRRLFELAASEMWESEARQLSVEDLRTYTELVSEDFGLDADQAAQLSTKVTSYAGFRPRHGERSSSTNFAFEHEVYFDYFLARAIQRMLRDAHFDELGVFLDRGVIPETVAPVAVRVLDRAASLDPSLLRCSIGIPFQNRRRNLGALLLAFAQEASPISNANIRGLSFIDVASGHARFHKVSFENCQFVGTDLRGVIFDDCDGPTSTFHGVKLNDASQMMMRGLRPGENVGSVHYEPKGDVYAPAEVREVMERLGTPFEEQATTPPTYSKKAKEIIDLLDRAIRAYRRTNILYEEDSGLKQLFGSSSWLDLKDLLLRHEIVTEEIRPSQGSNARAYRLRVTVDQLLTGQNATDIPKSATSGLWKDLRSM
jgi:hypothetical protein